MAQNYTLGSGGSRQRRRRIAKTTPQRLGVPYRVSQSQNMKQLSAQVDANFRHLIFEIINMLEPFLNLFDDQGNLSSIITNEIKKAKSSGIKDVPSVDEVSANVGGEGIAAGALASKNSVDLATSEVTNKVAANITNAFDKTADDADNVPESATKKWAGASGADFVKSSDSSDDITEGSSKKFVGSGGSGNLDDVEDAITYKRVKSVSAGNQIQTDSIAGDAVTGSKIPANTIQGDELDDNAITGAHYKESVVDEFQSMGSTLSDAQWDALTT